MDFFAYYVSHDLQANAERLADLPRMKECGLDGVCVSISPADEPFIAACKDAGLRICASGNGLTPKQLGQLAARYNNLESIVAQDDAHGYLNVLDALKNKVAKVKQDAAPLRDVISSGRMVREQDTQAFAEIATLCNVSTDFALQLYPYKWKEPLAFVYRWVKFVKERHKAGRVIASPQLFSNPDPYLSEKTKWMQNDPRLAFPAFPSAEHIRQWTWLSIIAGADAIYYYSLRDAGGLDSQQKAKGTFAYALDYFLNLADNRAALADVIKQVKSVESYIGGQAEVTETPALITATWPTQPGQNKRLCVKVNTSMDVPKTTVQIVERRTAQAEFDVITEV